MLFLSCLPQSFQDAGVKISGSPLLPLLTKGSLETLSKLLFLVQPREGAAPSALLVALKQKTRPFLLNGTEAAKRGKWPVEEEMREYVQVDTLHTRYQRSFKKGSMCEADGRAM